MKFICLAAWLLGTDARTLEASIKPHSEVASLQSHKNNFTVVDSQGKQDVTPESHLRRRSDTSSGDYFKKYHRYGTIKSTLHNWAAKHPKIATFIPSIGKTHEGRDIFAFKIATKGNSQRKRGIWFNGGQHAREWIAPAAVTYIIHRMLQDANTPIIKKLLDSFEFHFTPLANPDGYEFSQLPFYRMWRKNRRDNGDGTFGVDLNRNWDEHWKSSSEPTLKDTYPGPSPHSEPEVQTLANYALSIPRGYGYIDFHSFGQLILRNWLWSEKPSPNEDVLVELSKAVQQAFSEQGQKYTINTARDLGIASGSMIDWVAEKANFVSLLIELAPSRDQKRYSSFHLQENLILDCSKGAYAASLAFSKFLLEHPNISPQTTNRPSNQNPGSKEPISPKPEGEIQPTILPTKPHNANSQEPKSPAHDSPPKTSLSRSTQTDDLPNKKGSTLQEQKPPKPTKPNLPNTSSASAIPGNLSNKEYIAPNPHRDKPSAPPEAILPTRNRIPEADHSHPPRLNLPTNTPRTITQPPIPNSTKNFSGPLNKTASTRSNQAQTVSPTFYIIVFLYGLIV
ncbi:hypothetical protein DSO57_1033239 [Entomophthora muscae]|uniref:Uncharacterized protein n=1 Tax=Entomophthora muscae TaxID=34485 RepID=A0ACC2S282_9FUNG|nr:hypothetical protein DSO57_1033239 [Entomophthora muscae]